MSHTRWESTLFCLLSSALCSLTVRFLDAQELRERHSQSPLTRTKTKIEATYTHTCKCFSPYTNFNNICASGFKTSQDKRHHQRPFYNKVPKQLYKHRANRKGLFYFVKSRSFPVCPLHQGTPPTRAPHARNPLPH